MKAKLLLLLALLLPVVSVAQSPDKQKVALFATAVAHAEGFGVRHAIPTRYHNPGDLKSRRDLVKLPGQKRLGKGDHIVFANDAAGWAALHDYIAKMVDGRSKRFNPNMTLISCGKVYAQRWRPWVHRVSTELGVPPTTTLGDLLLVSNPEPPSVQVPVQPLALPTVSPVLPVLVQDNVQNNKVVSVNFQY